jgi:hypothetical protein
MQDLFTPYHPNFYRNRRIDLCHSVNATDTVFGFIKELAESGVIRPEEAPLDGCRVRTLKEAQWVLGQLNTPQARFGSLRSVQSDGKCWQQFDFVQSNLRNGYIFYFVCDRCGRRAKYLYQPDGLFYYACRDCHKLSYPAPQRRNKRASLILAQGGSVRVLAEHQG